MTGSTTKEPHLLTPESIADFLLHEEACGASCDCLRQRKKHVMSLYSWLPESKLLTPDVLRAWRRFLADGDFSYATVANYVKNVNRYLDFVGRSDLRFVRGHPKDLAGQTYGYLTAIAPTERRSRGDVVWQCRCRCGKEVFLPATRLLTGNTASCGCMQVETLRNVNQYIDRTSIRSAMEEKVESAHAASGYTGVTAKRGKWQAYITYKGRRYSLGCYQRIEDAVKARAYAKEMIREDAQRLQAIYQQLHKNDPPKATRKRSKTNVVSGSAESTAERTHHGNEY